MFIINIIIVGMKTIFIKYYLSPPQQKLSYFLDDAKSIQLHKKKSFQKDFEQHKNKAVVQYVLAMINGNLQPLDKKYEEKARKMYFDFRNEIVKKNNISIDSLSLKTFIM